MPKKETRADDKQFARVCAWCKANNWKVRVNLTGSHIMIIDKKTGRIVAQTR